MLTGLPALRSPSCSPQRRVGAHCGRGRWNDVGVGSALVGAAFRRPLCERPRRPAESKVDDP
eukprot:11786529-Heterocapsa_arctica.AAC.1